MLVHVEHSKPTPSGDSDELGAQMRYAELQNSKASAIGCGVMGLAVFVLLALFTQYKTAFTIGAVATVLLAIVRYAHRARQAVELERMHGFEARRSNDGV